MYAYCRGQPVGKYPIDIVGYFRAYYVSRNRVMNIIQAAPEFFDNRAGMTKIEIFCFIFIKLGSTVNVR